MIRYLDLVGGVGGKEHNLCKAAMWERAITYTAYNLITIFDDGQAFGIGVVYESRDVLPGHLWQLLLKEGL